MLSELYKLFVQEEQAMKGLAEGSEARFRAFLEEVIPNLLHASSTTHPVTLKALQSRVATSVVPDLTYRRLKQEVARSLKTHTHLQVARPLNPAAIPAGTTYEVRPDLMGGARIFQNGLLIDQSWSSRIRRLFGFSSV